MESRKLESTKARKSGANRRASKRHVLAFAFVLSYFRVFVIPSWILLAPALACVLGCHKDLQTVYGQRSGPGATESVNGTAVFAEMFETAGHRVSSWRSLSPRLEQADCIVWVPDDFQPPYPNVVNWFEHWLRARPQRTLIYVGRDFDAVPWYWRKMETTAPAGQRAAIAGLRAEAEHAFQAARKINHPSARCRWFTIRDRPAAGPATNVTGDLEWLQNIDPSRMEIEANSRMSADMDALLESDEGLIVGRRDIGRSQLLLVSNGSFLLNATLVNHEHRKLAGKLIDTIGPSGRDVVFLESGQLKIDQPTGSNPAGGPFETGPAPGDDYTRKGQPDAGGDDSGSGPFIRRTDPAADTPNGLELLLVWPTNWILLHFALIGILFCFWKLPIFGLPRPEDPSGVADFGRHIDAVAALLERTADRRYAISRVRHYQQVVKKSE